jgi:GrpB-like predicted nucleotidyltransferase (UPF0157 family)
MLTIKVVEYNPEWPAHFEQIRRELDHALSDFLDPNSYRIEHVGSTSIQGLASKPIIDIDIIVAGEHIMEATQALTSNDYTYAYEANGIDRMVFRYNRHKLDSGASRPTEDGSPRRAVYLNKADGAALANHLAVREVLRRDRNLRKEYGDLKLSLARSEHADIGAYGSKKHAMIRMILQASGLNEQDLARIQNKPQRRVDAEIREAKNRASADV